MALLETKKNLLNATLQRNIRQVFFVMIKIGVALNSPNINTQYVLMSQLGDTGYALATNCFNTCFIIRSERTLLMVDAGGGNGVLQQLNKVNVSLSDEVTKRV